MRVQADGAAYVATAVVMGMLGVSRQRVYELEREGKLLGQLVQGRWMWSVRSVESRLALLREEGRNVGNDW